jgi:hypothetical protein
MLEGFFKKLRGGLSEGPEEVSGSTIPDADIDIIESVVEELPTIEISPVLEGESSFDRQIMGLLPLPDREIPHVDVAPRQEHEPYRYEPDGDGQVCVTKAHLYEVHPKTGSITIHELDKTIISVSSNCVVYTKFKTDPHGAIDPPEYTLHTAKDLPPSTSHILKDEDGQGINGEYNTPIFYIKDGELDRDHWSDSEDNPREVKLYGGLRGHRGPLWWVKGYDSLRNIGGGKNVYKEYIRAADFKDLRTIKDIGGSCENKLQTGTDGDGNPVTLPDPFCGSARIRVHYDGELKADGITPTPNFDKANANSIVVRGNNFNNQWYVGAKRSAVVEDGLVNDMVNLPVETLVKKQLSPITVVTGYSSASSSVTAAAYPTSSDKVDVLTASGTPVSAAPPHAESDRAAAWSGGSTGNAYTGGTTTSAAPAHAESDRAAAWSGGNMSTSAHTGGSPATVVKTLGASDAWTGGTSTADNVVVSASVVSDYVRGGTVNSNMIQGTPNTTMWAGGTKMTLPWVKICVTSCSCSSSGSCESATTQCYWVLGAATAEESSAPADYKFVHDPTQVTGVTSVVKVTGVVNATTTGTGVESRVLGRGIVGTDIDENPFYNSVATTASVISGSTAVPVITGANYEQKFLKGEASPVTGLKKNMTDTTVIANAVDTQKFLKGEASPVSVPVAGSPVSVIKGSLPSVSISVPVATGTAQVWQKDTNWTGSLLDAADVSASQGLKVVKEPEEETSNCCTGS